MCLENESFESSRSPRCVGSGVLVTILLLKNEMRNNLLLIGKYKFSSLLVMIWIERYFPLVVKERNKS